MAFYPAPPDDDIADVQNNQMGKYTAPPTPISATPSVQVTASTIPAWEQNLGNFSGSFDNPFIQILNTIPDAGNWLASKLGEKEKIFADIPTFQVDPKSKSAKAGGLIGDITSFGVPFGRLSKAADVAMGAGKLGEITQKSHLLSQLASETVAGAGAGAATSPTGQRKSGAEFGGAGALIVGAPFKALAALTPKGISPELSETFKKQLAQSLPVDEMASNQMLSDISKSYVNKLNQASQLYKPIFEQLENKGVMMSHDDLKNYQNFLNKENVAPYKKFLSPQSLSSQGQQAPYGLSLLENNVNPNDLPDIDPYQATPQILDARGSPIRDGAQSMINPKHVHRYQSYLGRSAAKGLDGTENYLTTAARNALNKDLNKFLNENGVLDNYNEAKDYYRSQVAPYLNNDFFKRNLLKPLSKNMRGAMDNISVDNIDQIMPTGKIAAQFLPSSGKEGMYKINQAVDLLDGNKTSAANHLKSNLLLKHIGTDEDTGESVLNLKTLSNDYNKMSPSQKDFFLSPQEQKNLNAFNKVKGNISKKNLLAKIGGRAIFPTAGLVGYSEIEGKPPPLWTLLALGSAAASPELRGMLARRALQRKSLPQLSDIIQGREHAQPRLSTIPAMLGSLLGTQVQQQTR